MKILMIAPQPFLAERGAPFAIYHHIKTLISLGFEVNLITYRQGKPVEIPGLQTIRIPALRFIQRAKVGPSLAKFPLDALVFLVALWQLCIKRYNYIHTHEEAGLIGVVLSAIFGCKHLYYMDSDLSQHIVSSNFTGNPLLTHIARAIQAFIVRNSDAVIAIRSDIEMSVRQVSDETPMYTVENCAVDDTLPAPDQHKLAELQRALWRNGN